jgi:UDP-glucose 4-epimerase
MKELKEKKTLVTGGAGFIGSRLVEKLVDAESEVTVIDNLSEGKILNLKNVKNKILFIDSDIREDSTIKEIVKDKDIIFHFAANASVPRSTEDIDYDFETNVIGTFNILKNVHLYGNNTKVVFASSAAVYGEPEYIPINETHPLKPISPYGVSKLCGENYCAGFNRIFDVPTVIMRIFNSYGPRQPRYVLFDLLKKLSRNKKELEVLGTGEQKRDFIYVDDVANAFLLAALKDEALGLEFNVGTGEIVSIRELVDIIVELMGYADTTKVKYTGSSWKGDVNIFQSDISRARKLLGFEPTISIYDGVKKEIEWFKENYNLK